MSLSPEILVDPATLSVVVAPSPRRRPVVPVKLTLVGALVAWLGLLTTV